MADLRKKKPNIVCIMSDDQGIWSLGCYGNKEIQTPNLDRLAETGVKFNEFFCTSPVCSPARASILTGKIPSQHGVHDWIAGGNVEHPIEYLEEHVAYTEILAENDYVCGLSGKWHLGDSLKPQKGFSHWYVHQAGGGPYYDAPMVRDGTCMNEPSYLTEAITNDALQFLDDQTRNERPFYLGIHYTAPHDPWLNSHPEEFVQLYDDCAFETCPQNELQKWFSSTMNIGDDWREHAKGYYAAITAMDQQIGRVLDALEEKGVREDTVIIFMSDNGFSCGQHGFWGKGNGTFPLNMYDYSVKVPLIISQPGRITEGRSCDALLSGYDFMPTLLDYVGLDTYKHGTDLPGKSFAPLLAEESHVSENNAVVIYDEYGPVRMIRTKEWKYIHRYPYGPHELYHLTNDPLERINLIESPHHKAVWKELKYQLSNWFHEYVDTKVDGTKESVVGTGQINLAGLKNSGENAYYGRSDN